jgi:hypothetical protein
MLRRIAALTFAALGLVASASAQQTQLLWGDTHLHTSFSPDAYIFGNRSANPDDAYRFAKGLPMVHPYHKARIRLERPLDFLVVSDHAEMLGVPYKLFGGDPALGATETGKHWLELNAKGDITSVFQEFMRSVNDNVPIADFGGEIGRSIWQESTAITDRHNEPGKFTALVGWEWTSMPGGRNLHRVVFTPASGAAAAKFLPFSNFDSDQPEGLWKWFEQRSAEGLDFISIPHNSNLSDGMMFDEVDSAGRPISAEYARTRARWEPIVEVTQIKGDSETRAELSPSDELAGFEIFDYLLKAQPNGRLPAAPPPKAGSYARTALLRGLEIDARVGANPYKFGVIGSTDAHTSASSPDEDNFHGKTARDSIPESKFAEGGSVPYAEMSASGIAGVWAAENSREAIFAAFRRKEVYATTGPRIAVRFFGGFAFKPGDARAKDVASVGYEKGVPMGGDLTSAPAGKAPAFLVHVAKDPLGANLDRVQIVKGWLGEDGKARERITDIAWAGDREPGADGKLPPVGNTVDLATGEYANTIGAAQLAVVWRDPNFEPAQRAFYYVRALQIPTPRHTLYDALALKREHPKAPPAVLQERAYTSAIWYAPSP